MYTPVLFSTDVTPCSINIPSVVHRSLTATHHYHLELSIYDNHMTIYQTSCTGYLSAVEL